MAQSQQHPQGGPHLTYVDRLEVSETFVDSLRGAMFDGANLRMEFIVNRLDEPRPPQPLTGDSVTACRVVIPLAGAIDLATKIQAVVGQLQATGVIRQIQNPPTSGKPN